MADIELVIKIPEEMYQKIKETNMFISGRRSGKRFDYILFNAVNTGTLLPKGHGRLIDGDRLQAQLFNKTLDEHFVPVNKISCDDISECFDNTKTIIEAERSDKE